MTAERNVLDEFRDLAKECNLPVNILINKCLNMKTITFYNLTLTPYAIDAERRRLVEELIQLMQTLKAEGKLPIKRDDLIWAGIQTLTADRK